MLQYPIRLSEDTNSTILVDFPDVPEAHTFGSDREEALHRAVAALETALMGYMESWLAVPPPSRTKRGIVVTLPASSEAKLSLYSSMRAAGLDSSSLAKRLHKRLPEIARLLDLRHTSRLEELETAFQALGKRLSVQISDAA
jgi:antitoxin HicB